MRKTIGTPEQEIIRRLLKQHRIAAGLTQRQLGERLHTDHTRITSYEKGDRRMDLAQLDEYTAALGISLMDFVQLYVNAAQEARRSET